MLPVCKTKNDLELDRYECTGSAEFRELYTEALLNKEGNSYEQSGMYLFNEFYELVKNWSDALL